MGQLCTCWYHFLMLGVLCTLGILVPLERNSFHLEKIHHRHCMERIYPVCPIFGTCCSCQRYRYQTRCFSCSLGRRWSVHSRLLGKLELSGQEGSYRSIHFSKVSGIMCMSRRCSFGHLRCCECNLCIKLVVVLVLV